MANEKRTLGNGKPTDRQSGEKKRHEPSAGRRRHVNLKHKPRRTR